MGTPREDATTPAERGTGNEKPVYADGFLRAKLVEEQDKQAYATWLESLRPEEMQTFEKMGYHFQLLRAICQNPEMIALSADESTGERFSFREVVQLVNDLEKMAEKFLGRELERKPNAVLDQLANAYNFFRIFLAEQEKSTFTEEKDDYLLKVVPYFDKDFMALVENTLPADMVTLIRSGEAVDGENGVKVERSKLSAAYARLIGALQLNEEEKAQFKQALRRIVKVRQKVIDGNREGSKMNNLEVGDLTEIIEALGSMECLRRVFPSNPELGMRGNDKMFGLTEIERMVRFIRSWKKTFQWLGTMKMGKLFREKENEDQREKRLEEEREKRRDTIRNFTDSFAMIFPDPVAPMIVKRHREVLRRRVQSYHALAEMVNTVMDEKLKKDLKRVLFQISSILSYLDYMWNMHQVEENGAGTHIVYPKKMLLLGPLILQETENLMGTLNMLAEQYRGSLGEDQKDEESFFGNSEAPPPATGLGLNYDDSQAFRLGADTLISFTQDATREKALVAADAQTVADKKMTEQKDKLINTLWMMAGLFVFSVKNARRNLDATRVKTVMVNEEDGNEADQKATQTLSYDIHDFISDLNDVFSAALYEIARTFDEKITKHEVLPESAAQEDQAARLRSQIYTLGVQIRPAGEIMAYATTSTKDQIDREIVPGMQAIVPELARCINEFQRHQEQNLRDKKYHEVLRGAGYEKLVRLANSANDFAANFNEKLDTPTVELYILRKRLEEFAEKTQIAVGTGELPRNGATAAWQRDLEQLKRVEDRILRNGLKPSEMAELQDEYTGRFLQVITTLCSIARKDEIQHSVHGQSDTMTYKVTPQVREHFNAFNEANPLVDRCMDSDFTPCFYKFYKLTHLVSDFMQVCDLQKNPNTPEQEFLKEHDMRKAQILDTELKKLVVADYESTTRTQKNKLLLSLATCREALGHLVFRAPEQADTLDIVCADMENTIRVLYEHGKPIAPDDLETFYMQFIREAVENPINIR